jgi:hypothetical protein
MLNASWCWFGKGGASIGAGPGFRSCLPSLRTSSWMVTWDILYNSKLYGSGLTNY